MIGEAAKIFRMLVPLLLASDSPGEFLFPPIVQTSRSTAAGCDGESVDDEEKAESLDSLVELVGSTGVYLGEPTNLLGCMTLKKATKKLGRRFNKSANPD